MLRRNPRGTRFGHLDPVERRDLVVAAIESTILAEATD